MYFINVSIKAFLPRKTQNIAKKQYDFHYLRFLRPLRLNVFEYFHSIYLPVNTTHMDVGSAENAYVHGWTVVGQRICTGSTVVGQCICPWMDGSRTTQEQLSRSYCRGVVVEEQSPGNCSQGVLFS